MKILAFEFLTGGGVADQHSLSSELSEFLRQGRMMVEAVCNDFVANGHEVFSTIDQNVESKLVEYVECSPIEKESELESVLMRAASKADGVLLICPESGGCLARFAKLLQPWKDRFLSPDLEFIQLTGDKWKCHQWLDEHEVPCPDSVMSEDVGNGTLVPDFGFPVVAKPVDGAGSESILFVKNQDELAKLPAGLLLQEFVDGTPVSVSVIRNHDGVIHICEPGMQIFEGNPFGRQIGTEHSLENDLRERALRLAKLASDALPSTRGYFGIDMVLGKEPARDAVIEINPRLTTSYCELRKISSQNLTSFFF